MRTSIISLCTILLAATVSARWAWGACSTAPTSIPFDVSMQVNRAHKIVYVDSLVNWALNTARSFSSAVPQLSCLNLGTFPYDQAAYNSLFNNNANPLRFNMLYWNSLS